MSRQESYWFPRDITGAVARELTESGYRRVSRKHCILSRIDKGDWNKKHPHCPDFYRRIYSKDKIFVPRIISEAVPTSCINDPHFTRLIYLSEDVLHYIKRHVEASPSSIIHKPNSIKVRTYDRIHM
jgi:hypothetical protein